MPDNENLMWEGGLRKGNGQELSTAADNLSIPVNSR